MKAGPVIRFGLRVIMIICLGGLTPAVAQHSVYDQHEAFDPTFLNEPGTAFRSGSGQPGPMYWQNEPDYQISVVLHPDKKTISGTDEIYYTNNSPDELGYLWIQLDQNLYKQTSRGHIIADPKNPRYITPGFDGGYNIKSVEVEQNGKTYAPHYLITDTRMQIILTDPVKPKGGIVTVRIQYSYPIPPFRQRTGWFDTKNGPIFDIAQWYPRMCVYDDIIGWNTLPYLGRGQFYLEYGTINYKITVPWNYMVVGSGTLQNPQKVLTNEQIKRFEKAKKSEKTVVIRSADEVTDPQSRPVQKGTLTWHFRMQHTRDVAWAASPAFVWDAARMDLPDNKTALAEAAYPVEVATDKMWNAATQCVKKTIEYNSRQWYPYPWPTAVNVAARQGGMEYPGMVFCNWHDGGISLLGITTHEMGHSWFPMIVGSDERQYGFMDEGFDSFIGDGAMEYYKKGKYITGSASKMIQNFVKIIKKTGQPDPIIRFADAINPHYLGVDSYIKPDVGLHILRSYVLGPDRFDRAFRTYIRRWAFKHPTPDDFFRTMNDASGEDLNYFWKGWFYKTWTIDQAVVGVSYVHNKPEEGALITLENLQKLPMPVTVKVYESNGRSGIKKLPVEIWQRGGQWQFEYNSVSPIDSVVVDPDRMLPDINRSNNKWVSGEAG